MQHGRLDRPGNDDDGRGFVGLDQLDDERVVWLWGELSGGQLGYFGHGISAPIAGIPRPVGSSNPPGGPLN
jgi:hypothetical protein